MSQPYRMASPPVGCSPEDEQAFMKAERDRAYKEAVDLFGCSSAFLRAFRGYCDHKAAMLAAKVEHPKMLALLDRMCRDAADACVTNHAKAMDLQLDVDRLNAALEGK